MLSGRGRRSIRLRNYDYARPGAYFVTICVQGRACLLADAAEPLALSAAGEMAARWWETVPDHYPAVRLDGFVVMPNHLHGILVLGAGRQDGHGCPAGPALGAIVGWFKTMTTNAYLHGVKTAGWPAFEDRLWQRNYYERLIRDEAELDQVRAYIRNNPVHWLEDDEHPARAGLDR